ncbi:MAG: hypothetical protein CM1200mP41_16670 [Gammaproteobacteria bacterium]|nr:MAG: hypothetical protein CM1200mP41_16670 [Gammaproteobacteria bacterium]
MGVVADEAVKGLNLREVTYLTDPDAMFLVLMVAMRFPKSNQGIHFRFNNLRYDGFPQGGSDSPSWFIQ